MSDAKRLIWQVTSSRSWGGRESVPVALHQTFLMRGMPGHLICASGSAIAERFGDRPGVHVLPFAGLLDRRTRGTLHDMLKSAPPDVVLCHFSHDLMRLRFLLRGARMARLVLVKHVGPGRPRKDLVHRWVYRRVDGVLGVSEYVARRCRESYPVDPGRVHVWYPGVDVERFRFRSADRDRIRNELGLSEHDLLVMYVARLTPGKGHRDLLLAFSSLSSEKANLYLALVGSASRDEQAFAERLRSEADTLPGCRHVVWPGFVEDVAGWLSAADIFINPSPCEAFGLNTIEAMAVGRPVIGTTGGGTPDIIIYGTNGLLVEPGKPDALAHALLAFVENAEFRHRAGEAARDVAHTRFSLAQSVDRLLELLFGHMM